MFSEQFDGARRVYELTLADARRLGSALHHMLASTVRAALEYRAGRLADAEADARLALGGVAATAPPFWAALAAATLADALRERGELERAEAELDRRWPDEQLTGMLTFPDLLCARGRLRLAQSRPADALDDRRGRGAAGVARSAAAHPPGRPAGGTRPGRRRSTRTGRESGHR
jgi:ATP/maltotriose-dependent transcriptional regulator MalT